VVALLLGSALFGAIPAGATQPAASSEKPTTFTVALLNEVDSFNPFLGIEVESFEMWGLVYDSLTGYSMEDVSTEPSLATEWDTSEDGLTWTFTIRDDVSWSDGKPLTADDVAYTYNRIIDGKVERGSYWSSYLKGVTSATAPDATTVVLELKRPNVALPQLPIPILPEHVWSEVSSDEVKSYVSEPGEGKTVVGSGPFRLVEGTAGGSTYRFEANPDYWEGAPHIDEVVFRVFKSEDPAAQALIKGEVDFVYNLSALQVKSLQSREGITAHNAVTAGFDEIGFNAGSVDLDTGKPMGDPNPAVLDPAFRHALGYAMDRELIVERVYQGAGEPGTTIVPPTYGDFHWEPPSEQAFTFDLDGAARLLDEAGYELGDDGKRTLPDGSPIGTLRLHARAESNTSVDVMDFFKEWLAELGIDSEVIAVESNRLTNIILDGKFDVFEWGWYVDPDPQTMLSYMTCGQRGNWSDTWYCNEEYDELYEAQSAQLDPAARAEIVRDMQEILYEDAPYLLTAYNSVGEAFRSDKFACFQSQPDPGGSWLVQFGTHNYQQIRPAAEAGDCDGVATATGASQGSSGTDGNGGSAAGDDEGSNTGLLVAAAVLVAIFVAGGGILAMRRRTSVGDRE
jgi:peptide/nickel transport system substrate-binding protein